MADDLRSRCIARLEEEGGGLQLTREMAVDAILDVVAPELERAETAEAAVDRARHVCHKAMAEPDAPGQWLVAQQVLAAIDATEETDARQ